MKKLSAANSILAIFVAFVALFKISLLLFTKPRLMTMKCFHLHEESKAYSPLVQLQPNMYNFANTHYIETPRTATAFNNMKVNHFPARKATFKWRQKRPSRQKFTSTFLGTVHVTYIEIIPEGDGLKWIQLSE